MSGRYNFVARGLTCNACHVPTPDVIDRARALLKGSTGPER
jgi:hypothetical protein